MFDYEVSIAPKSLDRIMGIIVYFAPMATFAEN